MGRARGRIRLPKVQIASPAAAKAKQEGLSTSQLFHAVKKKADVPPEETDSSSEDGREEALSDEESPEDFAALARGIQLISEDCAAPADGAVGRHVEENAEVGAPVAAAPMCAFQGAIPQRRLAIGSLEVRRPVGRQDAEAAHDLMEWLRGRGANLDGVTLRKSPLGARAGLGVVATEQLESGHQALYIPRRAQLHADSQELHIASRGFAASTDALLGAAASG